MSDTLAAPASSGTPAAPVTETTISAPIDPLAGYAAARAELTGETWDTPQAPTDGMAVTDGDVDPADVTAPASIADGEFTQDDAGRWHRPDGTFANEAELAAITTELAKAPATEATEEAKPTENVVSLRRRDGSTREVVIDDPELADEIRTNMNDGMRGKEYREKVAALDARLAQFNKMDALLAQNPEAVVNESLSPDQRIRLGVMLLAQHFDELIPAINEYNTNPNARFAATAEAQLRIKKQTEEFNSYTSAQNAAAEVRQAVAKLIPEDAPQDVAESFWVDASRDCQEAMARGEHVSPATVQNLLATRMKLYGFAGSAAPAADSRPRIVARPASAAASAIAQPANDAAKQLATAQAAQKRIRLSQTNRRNAAAVPPVGAGAAPLRLPPAPKGQNIDAASQDLRKLGNSWTAIPR